MSTNPTNLFSTLNFWLQNAHDIPETVGIVFLYTLGRAVWNFSLCGVSLRHTKPDENGKLPSMCHSMYHSMRLTKPHEEGYRVLNEIDQKNFEIW